MMSTSYNDSLLMPFGTPNGAETQSSQYPDEQIPLHSTQKEPESSSSSSLPSLLLDSPDFKFQSQATSLFAQYESSPEESPKPADSLPDSPSVSLQEPQTNSNVTNDIEKKTLSTTDDHETVESVDPFASPSLAVKSVEKPKSSDDQLRNLSPKPLNFEVPRFRDAILRALNSTGAGGHDEDTDSSKLPTSGHDEHFKPFKPTWPVSIDDKPSNSNVDEDDEMDGSWFVTAEKSPQNDHERAQQPEIKEEMHPKPANNQATLSITELHVDDLVGWLDDHEFDRHSEFSQMNVDEDLKEPDTQKPLMDDESEREVTASKTAKRSIRNSLKEGHTVERVFGGPPHSNGRSTTSDSLIGDSKAPTSTTSTPNPTSHNRTTASTYRSAPYPPPSTVPSSLSSLSSTQPKKKLIKLQPTLRPSTVRHRVKNSINRVPTDPHTLCFICQGPTHGIFGSCRADSNSDAMMKAYYDLKSRLERNDYENEDEGKEWLWRARLMQRMLRKTGKVVTGINFGVLKDVSEVVDEEEE
jgi:hypothetical protein